MLETYISACKSYDIRWKYWELIDEKLAYILGIGIAKLAKKKNPNPTILIGSDVRIPNKKLITAFIAGLQSENISKIWAARTENNDIYPYGLCSTPMLYYFGHKEIDIGVAFTASHNPPEDVGMKFFDKDCTFLSQSTIREIVTAEYHKNIQLPELPDYYDIPRFPQLTTKYIQLQERLWSKFSSLKTLPPIAIDCSSWAGVGFEKQLIKDLLPNTILINDKPDGLFSAHLSETQDHENYKDVIRTIQDNNLSLGAMFDGDADRVGFVGPDGQVIGWDIVLSIIAEQLLKEYQNNNDKNIPLVLYEVMCSQSIAEIVEKHWGKSKMVRMGRFFIKEAMEQHSAIFAWETSGHFMFSEIGNYEMPLLVIYYILKAIEQYGSRDIMIKNIHNKYKSPVKSKKVSDKQKAITIIKSIFSERRQIEIDGISCYGEWVWFNIRASNTENKIRYTVEADTPEKMEEILEKIEKLLE